VRSLLLHLQPHQLQQPLLMLLMVLGDLGTVVVVAVAQDMAEAVVAVCSPTSKQLSSED